MRRSQRSAGASAAHAAERVGAALSKGERVVFLTGAGLSSASGLPVYRHAPDAMWETSVRTWGTRSAFESSPSAWWSGFFERGYERLLTATPNDGHGAIADVARRHPTACVVAQNVDGLHSGVPAAQLVEVHGTAKRLKCVAKGCPHATVSTVPLPSAARGDESAAAAAADATAAAAAAGDDDGIAARAAPPAPVTFTIDPADPPLCPLCGGPLCAAFLLFDEDYESHAVFDWDVATAWFQEAAVFVFVGTSFAVGATAKALAQVQRRGVPCFSFNTHVPEAVRRKRGLDMTHVLGAAEDTLPAFAAALAGVGAGVKGDG